MNVFLIGGGWSDELAPEIYGGFIEAAAAASVGGTTPRPARPHGHRRGVARPTTSATSTSSVSSAATTSRSCGCPRAHRSTQRWSSASARSTASSSAEGRRRSTTRRSSRHTAASGLAWRGDGLRGLLGGGRHRGQPRRHRRLAHRRHAGVPRGQQRGARRGDGRGGHRARAGGRRRPRRPVGQPLAARRRRRGGAGAPRRRHRRGHDPRPGRPHHRRRPRLERDARGDRRGAASRRRAALHRLAPMRAITIPEPGGPDALVLDEVPGPRACCRTRCSSTSPPPGSTGPTSCSAWGTTRPRPGRRSIPGSR